MGSAKPTSESDEAALIEDSAPPTTETATASLLPASAVTVLTAAVTGLLIMAALYVSTQMAPILIAVILSAMFKVMFSPLVELLKRAGIPRMASALLIVAAMPLLAGYSLMLLAHPVSEWLDQAPRTIDRIERRLIPLIKPIQNVQKAADAVEDLTSIPGQAADEVRVAAPRMLDQIAAGLPSLALGLSVTVFVTFFLLGSGDSFMRKLASAGQSFSARRRIVEAMRHIQNDVGDYLRTIGAINVLLGIVTAALMWALGLANPMMWGMLAALLNFAPYVGATIVIAALTLTGLATSNSLTSALIPPASYLILVIIEGQILTPAVLGHRMQLSPVVVFIGIVLAGWLWGLAGALVAVPVLVTVRIICEHCAHIELMRLIASLMGRPAGDPTRVGNA